MSKNKQKQGNQDKKAEELKNTSATGADETKKEEPKAPEADKRIEPYFKAYPKCDVFYRTSDGQVFREKSLAQNHQRTLKKGELKIIKRH